MTGVQPFKLGSLSGEEYSDFYSKNTSRRSEGVWFSNWNALGQANGTLGQVVGIQLKL